MARKMDLSLDGEVPTGMIEETDLDDALGVTRGSALSMENAGPEHFGYTSCFPGLWDRWILRKGATSRLLASA